MRRVLLAGLLLGCGGKTKAPEPPGDNNDCPIEMSVDPPEPTTATPITVQIADEAGASYQWSVTGGTIKSGQGTATIVVEGAPAGKLSATVALTGYGLKCPPTATASVEVKP